ncbi:hypothetical protein [Wolbachia endosymbiont of Folsomia candida]|uniref:hypothetical protein n=1 Tax=Wolbachia endosymbiont of Folsomia candida TaxID=169402 RepID=UPI0013006AA6|nr:hypothetical protein [Wolbachia endosymbiont of Folsomia candida]
MLNNQLGLDFITHICHPSPLFVIVCYLLSSSTLLVIPVLFFPVIPVRDTGIQPLIIANKQVYRFDVHKNSIFHAKNNVHYEKIGFQCLGTGMTPLGLLG